jgi:hypothetical protein
MDAQVNERLSRSTDDRGAERAVQIRRQQQAERTRLQNDISRSQGAIAKLNEERAPIAAEVRKVEAEVGPIKYIANFIYGDNPDANILEKAVTWVIIIIVSVFDPLAVILLLASQYSFQWFRIQEEESVPVSINDFVTQPTEHIPEEELEEEKPQPYSAVWPFPSSAYNPAPSWGTTPTHTEEVPSETPLTALGGDITAPEEPVVEVATESELDKWNKMIAEAEQEVAKEKELASAEAEKYHPTDTQYTEVTGDKIKPDVTEVTEAASVKLSDLKKKTYMTKDPTGKIQIKDREV